MTERDRSDELLEELNETPTETWDESFADSGHVRCFGCGTEYDSPVGLTIVALVLGGDGRRTYFDRPQCATLMNFAAVAGGMAESDESGLGPLTVDADGRTLPAWRIAEIREGRVWPPGAEPWRDDEESAAVVFYAVDPIRDPVGTLDEASKSEIGTASDDDVTSFLAESDEDEK